MGCVYIPVQNSEEEVRVALDQLPRDASDILDILKAEQAPLDLWLIIAREYFKQGKIEQFRQILEEGSGPEIDEYYADVKYERVAILNALGAYNSYLGKIETKQREKEEYFIQATGFYNRASRIDMHEPSTWVGKGARKTLKRWLPGPKMLMEDAFRHVREGFGNYVYMIIHQQNRRQLLLARGEIEQAFAAFKIVLDGNPDNVPALLGQACVQFNRGRYLESLELYKKALQVYPDCPGVIRLGIGFCRYKLGQFAKARQAFERVLQLDPENVEALVALGVMDLQANDAECIRRGMEKMQLAFEMYPYCATSLNYLANHFFFTGQHFLVEQLTETALAVTNHGPTKAHSYYNLARSYHSKGDYETAGRYYMWSVKESNKPQEFVLPYYGLGQVQLKMGEYRSAFSNFEKVLEAYPENCETLKALGHIYVLLQKTDKAIEVLKKVTRINPRDAQAFLDLGELLISSDSAAALEACKNARDLLRKGREDVPTELLNNIGVLQFERGELELAEQSFKEALGDGVWLVFLDGKENNYAFDATAALHHYKDFQMFYCLDQDGISVEVLWHQVSPLFNLGRLLEELHKTQSAIMVYRLILFKYPDYVDAFLRLAVIAKAQNNLQLSIELIGEALKVKEKSSSALSMLGIVEVKNDEWVKAKESFRASSEASKGNDSYSSICLGNWNYIAALHNEKRAPKLEATHLDKAKDLYINVLKQHPANVYAANGVGLVLAEKGQFESAKEILTQVQEAASGTTSAQMPDAWINLAHVYFAEGSFSLAVKMYQNCLRRFYYNTDSQVLLYLARTHYEAEQWQECKKTLLKAIHLTPSNYSLRFNVGVVIQKFSAAMLRNEKKNVDEARLAVSELKIALRLFSQLSSASTHHFHGFDEKKIETHVEYCKSILSTGEHHLLVLEREESQNKQRLELARQVTLAEEVRRKAEEQQKIQLEKRKQEEELKRVREQEEHLRRVKEQWRSSNQTSKRKDRNHSEDEEGEPGERRKRKGGKRRKKDKGTKLRYESEYPDSHTQEYQEDMEDEVNINYGEHPSQLNDRVGGEDNAQDLLAAAGLEDSDVDDDVGASSAANRRRQAWSESDDDEPLERQPASSPVRERSAESNGEPAGMED